MTQPPRPQVKKPRLTTMAIVMLLIGVAIGIAVGIAVGWSIGQSSSQAAQSEYTRIKVLSGSMQFAKLGNYTYYFYYKDSTHYGYSYDPQKPIEIDVQALTYTLPPTAGQTYHYGGIEVKVSEVYDDYIILLVKPM